jgi:hypothetical protein
MKVCSDIYTSSQKMTTCPVVGNVFANVPAKGSQAFPFGILVAMAMSGKN